jgi:hypothetical protein
MDGRGISAVVLVLDNAFVGSSLASWGGMVVHFMTPGLFDITALQA